MRLSSKFVDHLLLKLLLLKLALLLVTDGVLLVQLITAQEDILIKERELESARKKFEIIRSAKYKNRPQDYDSTDSGTDF